MRGCGVSFVGNLLPRGEGSRVKVSRGHWVIHRICSSLSATGYWKSCHLGIARGVCQLQRSILLNLNWQYLSCCYWTAVACSCHTNICTVTFLAEAHVHHHAAELQFGPRNSFLHMRKARELVFLVCNWGCERACLFCGEHSQLSWFVVVSSVSFAPPQEAIILLIYPQCNCLTGLLKCLCRVQSSVAAPTLRRNSGNWQTKGWCDGLDMSNCWCCWGSVVIDAGVSGERRWVHRTRDCMEYWRKNFSGLFPKGGNICF